MPQMLKIPDALHGHLKALAAARGATMVDVLHSFVRTAIDAGEIPDDVPGFHVQLLIDIDGNDFGPKVEIDTPSGKLPRMGREEALALAQRLADIQPGESKTTHKLNKGNRWSEWGVENVGTGIRLVGKPHDSEQRVEAVFTVAYARDFARQVRRVAEKAVPDNA